MTVQRRDGEVTGDRAVVVVVERQPGLLPAPPPRRRRAGSRGRRPWPRPARRRPVPDERLDAAPWGAAALALATRSASTSSRWASVTVSGSCRVARTITSACSAVKAPSASAMGGGRPLGQPGREADLPVGGGLVAVGHRRRPLPGARHGPARPRRTGLVRRRQQLQLDRAHLGLGPPQQPAAGRPAPQPLNAGELDLAERVEAPQQRGRRQRRGEGEHRGTSLFEHMFE